MLATAMRIAQRMGIDAEAANAKHPVLEAELVCSTVWSVLLLLTESSDEDFGGPSCSLIAV